MTNEISIEDYFKYHPPTTPERVANHEKVNQAALEFAKTVVATTEDTDLKKMAIAAIQQARMFANQAITIDDLRSKL